MGKVENMSIVLGRIKERGLFQSITRFQYLPVDMEVAWEIINAIGKERNPNSKSMMKTASHTKI
jgi:hypothetical protein